MSNLVISDLHVDVLTEEGPKQILKGMDLTVSFGEVHAIMGPNGPGKSTLVYAIVGHPKYEITSGSVALDGAELIDLTVDERVQQGLSLAMQHPVEVLGISMTNFLRIVKTTLDGKVPKIRIWVKDVENVLNRVNPDDSFSVRSADEGSSGGEEKYHEIAQSEFLNLRAAILDETDSGLDIDALRIASEGVNHYSAQGDRAVMLITHYARILCYTDPTFVYVFVNGCVVDQGGCELADKLEAEGCGAYVRTTVANV